MENVKEDLTTGSTEINEDEEFYENLEAPKFVNFTALDLSQPDDESWFCHKIGCDLNHEQIDPEALNKSFMLRVMAARSPNVRLHKALKRSNGRLNANCPHSAPVKQPRSSRLFRLSTATEVPEKLANSKLKNHLISSLKSPQSQAKKMVLTTIGEKEATSTPKNQPASGGKNGLAFFSAKPLFSPSPKKEIKEVCLKLRKLNLNNMKKRSVPSRYLGQVSKVAKRSDKSKQSDSIPRQETEVAPGKNISRPLWKTKQQHLEENIHHLGSDVINREQNSKLDPQKERPTRKISRAIWKESLEHASTSGAENKGIGKVLVLKPEIREKLETGPKRKTARPLWKSNQPVMKPNIENGITSGTKNEEVVKKEGLKSKTKDNVGTGVEKEGLKPELGNCDENKENIIQNDAQRVEIRKKTKAEGKKSTLLRTIENIAPKQNKVLKIQKKPSQANPDQGAKNKKTTNPKPFRFRTDERGILKEANLEKKKLVQSEPLKEESKSVPRKDTGIRCKGRVIPSKFQCLNKGPTSLASKRKNAPSILCQKKQEAIGSTKQLEEVVQKRLHVLVMPIGSVKCQKKIACPHLPFTCQCQNLTNYIKPTCSA